MTSTIYVVLRDPDGTMRSTESEPTKAFRSRAKADELAATGAGGYSAIVRAVELDEENNA